MKLYLFVGAISLLLLNSCNNQSKRADQEQTNYTETDHQSEHRHEHDSKDEKQNAHQEEIILSPNKAKAAGVHSATIHPGEFYEVIKTSGQILNAQGEERTVAATVNGIVTFQRSLTEGMNINNGAPLVILSSQNMADGNPVQRIRIAYETSKKEYERMKSLIANKIVSEKEFSQAKATYENARINYEALVQGYSSNGQNVISPMSGYVKSIYVKEGQYVEMGQPLISITQNRKLLLRADVSEKYYSALPHITTANFRNPHTNTAYSLKNMNGKVLSYGKSVNESNGYFLPVIFEFDNKGDIIPGMFVEIFLLSSPMQDVLSVPHSALTEEQGSFFVYLQEDEEGYRKQLVTLGADNGQRVQILSGVKDGDRVVVEGAYQVKLASATNAIPAHTHQH